MKTFYVIKHDDTTVSRTLGCTASTDPELFRKINPLRIDWSRKVRATCQQEAIIKARLGKAYHQ